MSTEDFESGDTASGPYCEHWSDPADCEEECACGHACSVHCGGPCRSYDCGCEEFTNPTKDPLVDIANMTGAKR